MAARFALPSDVDARSAAALQQQLASLRGEDLDLDGSGVERLAAPGLQVLLSARRTWSEDGRTLRLVDPSAPLGARLDLFGASAVFAA